MSLRLALQRWPAEVHQASTALTRIARVIRLGLPTLIALRHLDGSFGNDARSVRSVIAMHGEVGGDLAAMLEQLASSIDHREALERKGRAASAGMIASARLVAVLPLFFLPTGSTSGASLRDPVTLCLLMFGAGLTWIGLRWIRRLLPRVDGHTSLDATIGLLSTALAGGVDHHSALRACARHTEGDSTEELARAARRVSLGMPWSQALARCSGDLAHLGETIAISIERGVPPQRAFAELERSLRTRDEARYTTAIRKAPIRMVLPLTLCILPAYAILAAAPFLRAIAA